MHMKRALWLFVLTIPLAAQQFDRGLTTLPPAFAPARFDAVYRQLLSDSPPSGVYAFELGPHYLYFQAAERRYTASFETVPVHDGEDLAENDSFLLLVPTMQWVRSPRGFAMMDEWGIRVHRPSDTRLGVVFPGARDLFDGDRLAYLAIVQIEPHAAPLLMKSDEPEFREATGSGVHESDGQRIVEHAVSARIISIWAYDTTTREVLGKHDY